MKCLQDINIDEVHLEKPSQRGCMAPTFGESEAIKPPNLQFSDSNSQFFHPSACCVNDTDGSSNKELSTMLKGLAEVHSNPGV